MAIQLATPRLTAAERYQQRLQFCLDNIEFREDIFGLFAIVPSTTKVIGVYVVSIDETTLYSTKCTCPAGKEHGLDCIHRLGVDLTLAPYRPTFTEQCNGVKVSRITIDQLLGKQTPVEVVLAGYDVVGEALKVAQQAEIDDEIGNAYEVLASTKQVSQSKMCHGRLWSGDYCFYGAHYLEEVSHAS